MKGKPSASVTKNHLNGYDACYKLHMPEYRCKASMSSEKTKTCPSVSINYQERKSFYHSRTKAGNNLVLAHCMNLQQVLACNKLPRVESPQALPVAEQCTGPCCRGNVRRARDGAHIGHEILAKKRRRHAALDLHVT
jgi:hypothetical protein